MTSMVVNNRFHAMHGFTHTPTREWVDTLFTLPHQSLMDIIHDAKDGTQAGMEIKGLARWIIIEKLHILSKPSPFCVGAA